MSIITNLLKVVAVPLVIPLAISPVNSLVDRMTGGTINRDIIGRNFFSGLWGLTVAYFSRSNPYDR